MTEPEPLIVCVIPARGGSKGIRDKNIRQVLGRPLIAYSIECGLACPSIDHVVVTTDSDRIAEIALKYGAEVPFMRPAGLAGDTTPMMPVLEHALHACEGLYATEIEALVLLSPANPLRTPKDVEKCLEIFRQGPCDAVITAVPARRNPYFNMVVEKGGYARLVIEPEVPIGRRQDCPAVYDLNDSIWVFSRETIVERKDRIPEKSRLYVMGQDSALDVDDELDLEILETIMERRHV